MHQYLDSDGSGTHAECVSSTIGSERLEAATNWLRENGKIGMIGEFAGGVNEECEAAIDDMLAYLADNTDVVSTYLIFRPDEAALLTSVLVQWTGAVWWSAGPWWGDYMYSVEPTDGPAYSTYVPVLKQYA